MTQSGLCCYLGSSLKLGPVGVHRMLIAKWLGWFRQHQITTVFVLEILAVFIGISVSLIVDDWRQARTDQGQVHKILTKIHGNLLEHRDLYRVQALRKTLAAEDALAFALRNEFLWGDADNSSIFGLIFDEPFVPSRLVDLERLVRSELLANFPELQAKLDFYNNLMQNQFANNGKMLDIATDVQIDLFRSSGVIFPQGDTTLSGEQEPRSGIEQRSRDLATAPYLDMSQQELREYNVVALRSAVADEEFRALLTTLATLHVDGASEALEMEYLADEMIVTIETFAPSIRRRFDAIGIDGTATGGEFSDAGGPSQSVPMLRSPKDQDVWFLTADLVDGEFVFRADNSWDRYWGAPRTYHNFKRGGGYEFFGDADDVFPQGTAESGGLNIPVDVGRYEITFNSHTLEYSFDLVNGPES